MATIISNLSNISNIRIQKGLSVVIGEWFASFTVKSSNTLVRKVVKTDTDEYYVVGTYNDSEISRGFVLYLDKNLNIKKSFEYNGNDNLGAGFESLVIDDNANVFVCGYITTSTARDGVALKLSDTLQPLDILRISGGDESGSSWYDTEFYDIASTNGIIAMVGKGHYMNGNEPRGAVCVVSFTDYMGSVRRKMYLGDASNRPYAFTQTITSIDGNFFVTAGIYKSDTPLQYQEHGIFKFDTSLNLIGDRSIRSVRMNNSSSQYIVEPRSTIKLGSYYFAFGRVSGVPGYNHCLQIVKLNSDLTVNDYIVLSGNSGAVDTPVDLLVNGNGELVVVSQTVNEVSGVDENHLTLITMNSTLSITGQKHIHGISTDFTADVYARHSKVDYDASKDMITIPYFRYTSVDNIPHSGLLNIQADLSMEDGVYGDYKVESFPLINVTDQVSTTSKTGQLTTVSLPGLGTPSVTNTTNDLVTNFSDYVFTSIR